jgi:hypothetical protein
MGYISYKAAAEVVQRGSIKDLGFTRADLVAAQVIYGTPAPYLLGQGTQQTNRAQPDDVIPVHESVDQDLQVDLFFFLGNVFFLSISVLLGLIMVTHLGPGNDRNSIGERKSHGDRQTEGSKAKAESSLLDHVSKYTAKEFRIRRVTSDGEAAVKSVRSDVEALGTELNIFGHGSHTPHAESATRILKHCTLDIAQLTVPTTFQACGRPDRICRSHLKYGTKGEPGRTPSCSYCVHRPRTKFLSRCSLRF